MPDIEKKKKMGKAKKKERDLSLYKSNFRDTK